MDYDEYVPVSKVDDDILIKCRLSGNLTGEVLDTLAEETGVQYECSLDTYSREAQPKDVLVAHSIRGWVKKKRLKMLKERVKDLGCAMTHDGHAFVKRTIPEGYLFSGWKTGRKTKTKPENLPESFVYVRNYKKHGYVQTAGVKDILYRPCPFHNHAYKDDFLYISYDGKINEEDEKAIWDYEYIFGNDIIDVILGIEENNAKNLWLQEKIRKVKEKMVEQYNLYIDEMEESGFRRETGGKIERLEELREGRE